MASLFGISAADVLAKIVPVGGADDFTFSIGEVGPPTNDLSSADCLAIVEEQEAMVESYMRHKYQKLLRRVEGEVAVKYASEGQLTCQASLFPVTSMRVFKNFPSSRAWPDRMPSEAMDEDEFSVDGATGVVTFAEGLRANDRIYLDYEHSGCGMLKDLRHLVLNLTVVEIARRFAYFRAADGFDRFEGWQSSSAGHLRDLGRADGIQIGLFDRIDLVNETKNLGIGWL